MPVEPSWPPVEQNKDRRRHPKGKQQPQRCQIPRRVEDRQNNQPGRIIGNGQQQQKPDCRVVCAEDDASDQIAERDVGCGGDGPTVGDGVIGVRPQKQREAQIDGDRAEHPARGCEKRCCGPFAAQGAVLEDHRLPHFFGGNGKEERHQHIVDEVVQGQGAMTVMQVSDGRVVPDHELGKGMIAMRVGIGPDERNECPEDQQQGVFSDEIPDAIHISHPAFG